MLAIMFKVILILITAGIGIYLCYLATLYIQHQIKKARNTFIIEYDVQEQRYYVRYHKKYLRREKDIISLVDIKSSASSYVRRARAIDLVNLARTMIVGATDRIKDVEVKK